jgi:adenine-specific DNA-methyltransferase
MNTKVLNFLKNSCSSEPVKIDRLIISAFLAIKKIKVKENRFLKTFIIPKSNKAEYLKLNEFILVVKTELRTNSIEQLIELFEFVISPEDRIINGAIYTPLHIRKYIINQSFAAKREAIDSVKIADIACGCGGFIYYAAKQIKKLTTKSYFEIFRDQIFGLDIQSYSITRAKLLLIVLAISEGEDRKEFQFNLFTGDALSFDWQGVVKGFTGFDIILGNPPYVCSRNLTTETKNKLSNWAVCKTGHPDLYIPFFQIGIEHLASEGILGFITMNSFFKSLNGRGVRDYFQKKSLKFRIIDFSTKQVFKSRNTYTCICFIENTRQSYIRYYKAEDIKKLPGNLKAFNKIDYAVLDFKKGWSLQNNTVISKIEATGISFGKLYKTRSGIATLKNQIYIFKPVNEDRDYYYLQNGSLYQIEKGICRDILNSNKLTETSDLSELKQKVIFPYDDSNRPKLLSEDVMQNQYPMAYRYLQNKKNILKQRDKGKGSYENWFAFGRTQSLEKMEHKLFFPHFSDKTPNFLLDSDDSLRFYNGLAVIGESIPELTIIRKIMESRLFWFYIKNTSKPYTSGYYSLSSNYIRNFGICKLSEEEQAFVINEDNRNVLDAFFEEKYGVDIKV